MDQEISSRISKFAQNAIEAFPILDKNQNGILEKNEIETAVVNPSLTGPAAETAALLYREADDIRRITKRPDITRDTFATLGGEVDARLRQCADAPFGLSTTWQTPILWTLKVAKDIDKDANGFLSRKELANGNEAGKFLNKHFEEIQKLSDSPFKSKGLDTRAISGFMQSFDDKCGAVFNINGMLKRTQRLAEPGISRELFGDKVNPLNSINIEAIKQGAIGNCQFEATLGMVALKEPSTIANMVKENQDGSYTVTFPGAPDAPVTVSKPTDAELMLFNGPSKYGTWASVIEKAFAEYKLIKNGSNPSDSPKQETLNQGATPEEALQLLTGRASNRVEWSMPLGNDDIRAALIDAQKNNKILVGGIDMFQNFLSQNYDIPAGHAYSIMNFDPNGLDGGTVTLRNPWGRDDGPRGKFQMSLNEFKKVFSRVYVA